MLGSENQRSAMRGKASGVHRLTAAMKASTTMISPFAWARASAATVPSVLSTSQVAPSSA
jgi:hypothetical protein